MSKTIKIAILTGTIALTLLSGCTDPATNTPQNTPNTQQIADNICTFLSDEQLETILGPDFQIQEKKELDHLTYSCKFVDTKEDPNIAKNFNIIARLAKDEEMSKNNYEETISLWKNKALTNRTNQEIEDLGTEAFWTQGVRSGQLTVYKDTTLYIISLGHYADDPEKMLDYAKTIATEAMASF